MLWKQLFQRTAAPALRKRVPANLHFTSAPLLPAFIINDMLNELTMQVIMEQRWQCTFWKAEHINSLLAELIAPWFLLRPVSRTYAQKKPLPADKAAANYKFWLQKEEVTDFFSRERGQYASEGFTSQLHLKLQLLLFYPCYSTSSGEAEDYCRMFSQATH